MWLLPLVLVGNAVSAPPDAVVRRDDVVIVPPQRERKAGVAHTIYLDRCVGGCVVTTGPTDAHANVSGVPVHGGTLAAFQFGDAAWDAVVQCVAETYAPYGATVVTQEPTGDAYVKVLVAGVPAALGFDSTTLGIAPLTSDCSSQHDVIAFAFANAHAGGNVLDVCATAAHEAGHAFGLDHEFDCHDPMTYLTGCGQKLFVNRSIACGEFEAQGTRACHCGDTQNSHVKLTRELGAGVQPAPPTVTILAPAEGVQVSRSQFVAVHVETLRRIDRVELWVNGWPWASVPGTSGGTYSIGVPVEVPDGQWDLELRAYDDVGGVGAARRTVRRGAPCGDAATCLADQHCDAGRCTFDPATGTVGEACASDDECAGHLCAGIGGDDQCTSRCTPGLASGAILSCGGDLTCLDTGTGQGVCGLPGTSGGCCDAGPGGSAPLLLGLGVAAMLLRRRRAQRGQGAV